MFTGIVETTGKIVQISAAGTNKTFWIESPLSSSFKVDQSVSHDGVCLTVEAIRDKQHKVTAILETLNKTALNTWTENTSVNIERSLQVNSRLDGHFVQGHVDTTAVCDKIENKNGSYEYSFSFPGEHAPLVIEKGSICINGVSLTVFDLKEDSFKVAIIPYTFEHTNFQSLKTGQRVNIEFDMIGKYILRKLSLK
ncbi:MAG TPA: riboflavin synthase [Flavisolibacter sp.]|nr:riboflavin synthase [Flavisolibacter sp.]